MDSTNHPRFDPDYWEWPGKVIVIPFDKTEKIPDNNDHLRYGDNLLQFSYHLTLPTITGGDKPVA